MATGEQAEGSNYRDDSKEIADNAAGPNYQSGEHDGSEIADGSSVRDDSKTIAESADGSNYRRTESETRSD